MKKPDSRKLLIIWKKATVYTHAALLKGAPYDSFQHDPSCTAHNSHI